MKLMLVADTSGNPDEGMKNIARNLQTALAGHAGIECRIVSAREVLSGVSRVDVVQFVGGPSWRTFCVAALVRVLRRARTVLTYSNPIWSRAATCCAAVLQPSLALAMDQRWATFLSITGQRHERCDLVGVDPERFRPDPAARAAVRADLGVADDVTMVLHVGHLKADRNLEALLRYQAVDGVQVVVVGSSTTRTSGALVERLEAAGVRLVRGYVPRIQDMYAAADLYAFPTLAGDAAVQFPLSVLEALATGTPVVATRFGALPEVLAGHPGVRFADALGCDIDAELAHAATAVDPSSVAAFSWARRAETLLGLYRGLQR